MVVKEEKSCMIVIPINKEDTMTLNINQEIDKFIQNFDILKEDDAMILIHFPATKGYERSDALGFVVSLEQKLSNTYVESLMSLFERPQIEHPDVYFVLVKQDNHEHFLELDGELLNIKRFIGLSSDDTPIRYKIEPIDFDCTYDEASKISSLYHLITQVAYKQDLDFNHIIWKDPVMYTVVGEVETYIDYVEVSLLNIKWLEEFEDFLTEIIVQSNFSSNVPMDLLRPVIGHLDPIGLIEVGASEYEYDVETAVILRFLRPNITAHTVARIITRVFEYFFDVEDSGSYEEFEEILEAASKIIHLYYGYRNMN